MQLVHFVYFKMQEKEFHFWRKNCQKEDKLSVVFFHKVWIADLRERERKGVRSVEGEGELVKRFLTPISHPKRQRQ